VNAACVVFIISSRPTVGLLPLLWQQLPPNGWAVATVVAAVDAVVAVVLAGAAFKASNAPLAVRIVAVSFDIMSMRGRCLLCGERHEKSSSCPCPRCHECHAGGDAGCLNCAICGRWHAQDNCLSVFVAKCCKMCGDPHDPHRPCPCPYCHYWHAGVCHAHAHM
jgi:hypothetical protein